MPQNNSASVENNFTAGLKTEFTGLNFPENAATDADNVVFDLVGNVRRRYGFEYEQNYATSFNEASGNKAMSTYLWKNAGGDGSSQLLVQQFGTNLHFYQVTSATVAAPLSTKKLVSTLDLNNYTVLDSSLTVANIECEYADGNGYLFVYHPSLDPIYCRYSAGVIDGNAIQINIRDFTGLVESGVAVNNRPATLTDVHKYNLVNQGWTSGANWTATTNNAVNLQLGSTSFTGVQSGLSVINGQAVSISFPGYNTAGRFYFLVNATGVVTAYTGTTLTVNVNSISGYPAGTGAGIYPSGANIGQPGWSITSTNTGYINTFFTSQGSYPSNADVWWTFKNASDVFDPTTTVPNVTSNTGPASGGRLILNAFNQNRSSAATVSNITTVSTFYRPRTGTWFQGRVWYAGVDGSQVATGTAQDTYWTEDIYFSQIIKDVDDFGTCYQTNDPTSEDFFSLLPTDGGVVKIQGCGAVYKLFPIQNGMIVFAANGIWFITGSQGIGFTANDYTITKISEIRSLSSKSFVNVQGMPIFWNEEGIYTITPAQQGLGLQVQSLTFNTIDTMYVDIPVSSKQAARGDYNSLEYIVQWLYRDTPAANTNEKYLFNKVLCYNTQTKAFYTYTLPTASVHINGINYIPDYGLNSPTGTFKYLTSNVASSINYFTFSEERDEDYLDWETTAPTNYISYFETGYKIRGQAQRRWQPGYVYIFSLTEEPVSYKIQGIFDYATTGNSGRWSSNQVITIDEPDFGMVFRRHKLRGQGLVMQIRVSSVDGEPFNIIGWSIWETSNTGV